MSTRSLWSSGNPSLYLPIVFSLLSGCADPVIVDPIPDGGTTKPGDGMTNTSLPRFIANARLDPALLSETGVVDPNRRWKRDPHFVKDGSTSYLFFSGSNFSAEQWSISYFSDPAGGDLTNSSTWRLIFGARAAGNWDSKDLTAPFALRTSTGWSLYYAANGDTTAGMSKPDYVLQIGRATGTDPTALTREAVPVLPTPAFSGTDANATPAMVRKDAWGVTDPWVISESNALVMYYAGLDCQSDPCQFRIFRSVSTDNGATFPPGDVVLSGRPGNADEAGGVAGPSVVVRNGVYLLAYTAVKNPPTKARDGIRRALATGSVGLAVSSDGKNFQPGTRDNELVFPVTTSANYRSSGCSSPSLYLDNMALRGYLAGLSDSPSQGTYYSLGDMTITQDTSQ
jgi:hypothetical protein